MAKKKKEVEGDAALARVSADEGISALLARRGDVSGIAELTKDGVTVVRRGDSFIPLASNALVTAGSRDHASQAAEAEARRKTTGEIISVREIVRGEFQGQIEQLNAALRAKDEEISRINVEFSKLREENKKLLEERAKTRIGAVLSEGDRPIKKKKKAKATVQGV